MKTVVYFDFMKFSAMYHGYENTNLHFVRKTCEKSRPFILELLVSIYVMQDFVRGVVFQRSDMIIGPFMKQTR